MAKYAPGYDSGNKALIYHIHPTTDIRFFIAEIKLLIPLETDERYDSSIKGINYNLKCF
jgi:hypothetical protein